MNTPTNTNTKRHPWLAVFLSLLMPGLGQLYCGATIKCFWIAGAMSVIGMFSLVPLALMPLIKNRRHLAATPVSWRDHLLDLTPSRRDCCPSRARAKSNPLVRSRIGIAGILAGTLVHLRAADHDLPAHEIGPVQFGRGFLGGFQRFHFDKAEALGAIGVAVHRDLHILHRADLREEIEQIALGGLVGEIAHVELGRNDLLRNRIGLRGPVLAPGAFGPRFGVRAP
jgi:hypothetical protein